MDRKYLTENHYFMIKFIRITDDVANTTHTQPMPLSYHIPVEIFHHSFPIFSLTT